MGSLKIMARVSGKPPFLVSSTPKTYSVNQSKIGQLDFLRSGELFKPSGEMPLLERLFFCLLFQTRHLKPVTWYISRMSESVPSAWFWNLGFGMTAFSMSEGGGLLLGELIRSWVALLLTPQASPSEALLRYT